MLRKDSKHALAETLKHRPFIGFWDHVMIAAMLGRPGRDDEANERIERLTEEKPDFALRARELIGRTLKIDPLIDDLLDGLSRAGMRSDSALTPHRTTNPQNLGYTRQPDPKTGRREEDRAMRTTNLWRGRATVIVISVCWLVAAPMAQAQSKKSAKQTASLEKAGEASKAAVQDVLTSLGSLLAGYNAIINGEAKDNQKAYKKLVGDLNGTQKKIDASKKQLTSLGKEADKFFKAWEQDIASISSESLREKSAGRMKVAQQNYASLGETLAAAGGEFAPVMQNLNDQILYLGRDLSPEAIADLEDEAAELNAQAEAATAKVKAMLETAGKTQADADAELDAEEGE